MPDPEISSTEEEVILQVLEEGISEVLVTEDQAYITINDEEEVLVVEINSESSVQQLEVGVVGPQGPTGPIGPTGATGAGVPEGGLTGQLLTKTSGDDYDTEWTSEPRVDSLQFDVEAAVGDLQEGQLAWNADEGTLELGKNGVSNYVGAETMVLCRNASNTVTIPKGTAVMFAGTLGASGRIKVTPMVANGTQPGYVFFGVTDQSILGGVDGYVTVFGKIRGVNTSAYVDGDVLWCNPAVAGGFTKVEPQAPNLKLAVAAVVSAGNNGVIFVRWTTGARLQDLHDVEANGSKTDGDVLTWNTTANRWEATAPVAMPTALADLTDVNVSAKTSKSILYYDAVVNEWKGDNLQTILTVTDGGNF
jgi:hypothetical protein